MHPMIGKTFKGTIDGEIRTYEIIKIDTDLGWITLQRHGQKSVLSTRGYTQTLPR